MKVERYIVEIEMPDCDMASSAWVCDTLQTDSDIEDEGRWKVSVKEYWKPSDEHYELEEFAKIVRSNLTGISKAVQELFEAKYLQLTGNKMYGGFKD